jgi:hypothetical protein
MQDHENILKNFFADLTNPVHTIVDICVVGFICVGCWLVLVLLPTNGARTMRWKTGFLYGEIDVSSFDRSGEI